jgi:hypothetical protein
VDLDAVESRGLGVLGGAPVILDDGRDLVCPELAWLDMVLHAVLGERLPLGGDRRRSHRLLAVVQIRVRDPAGVPQLQEEAPSGRVDGVDDRLPGGDLGV